MSVNAFSYAEDTIFESRLWDRQGPQKNL